MENNNVVGGNDIWGGNYIRGGNAIRGGNYIWGGNAIRGGNYISGGNYIWGGNDIWGGNYIRGGNAIRGGNYIWGGNDISGGNDIWGAVNCRGIDRKIFAADVKSIPTIFGKEVSEERFNSVFEELNSFNWYPKFNNAFELYSKVGNDWKLVKASEICATLENSNEPYQAWKDMPKNMLEYIKSLPEFDAKIFKRVTGIDIDAEGPTMEIGGAKYKVSDIEAALKTIKPIGK